MKLGEVDYGFGDYQKAADAINQGLTKGQVKHLDEAYVYLGLAAGSAEEHRGGQEGAGAIEDVPNISPRVLKLWELYAAKWVYRRSVIVRNSDDHQSWRQDAGRQIHAHDQGRAAEATADELFKGKTVVLFSVPGAFTPTCDAKHLPGFVELADKIKAKGVDTIACTAVNDVS